ncbi:hypothetical protein DVK05_04765 [Halorubrum sp. Atlit-8R]|uniref:hypothetical protein n=1 Tax=unclassified Halorubrum TaxID=2642239 RepID=UPI000EF278E7|nr:MULTISPECIES: hypothetical protein [unclassified Halorubrum]RLM70745.1 hypothetical protein DVK08_00995 [Halorubrum sp. Atlit-9R]RLM71613.1 hypothetical protein DVK08_05735 [Halorubrum sp. Atlit-9R]RLM83102.1 hypothetical protein DVK05_04765 [Halorubrum sp. Atlit-8R]
MVPDPAAVSRRRVLATLGGGVAALAGGTAAVGATEPTALPDPITDAATNHYPTPPEVDTLWRPPVTEAHASAAVETLAATVAESRRRWDEIGDVEDEGAPITTDSGGWLEDARESLDEGDYPTALFRARYGLQFAGEALGYARAEQDAVDRAALGDRAVALTERAQAVASDLKPYPTSEPARDLGWYVRIEAEVQSASALADRALPDDDSGGSDGDASGGELDPRVAGELTAGLLRAELDARSAERYRDLLSERLASETTPHAEALRTAADRFRADLRGYPTREDARERYVGEADEYGPWEVAHSRLAQWCLGSSAPVPWRTPIDADLLALRAVALSIGLARRRAHETAVERLVVEPDDTGFDSGYALAAKRRAQATYRSVVGDDPSPLLVTQIGRAVEDLQVAAVGFVGGRDEPMWRERLEAYLYALVGRAKLEAFPPLRDAITDPD